jgi:hypothetical protein
MGRAACHPPPPSPAWLLAGSRFVKLVAEHRGYSASRTGLRYCFRCAAGCPQRLSRSELFIDCEDQPLKNVRLLHIMMPPGQPPQCYGPPLWPTQILSR